jgi:hypothetical protein
METYFFYSVNVKNTNRSLVMSDAKTLEECKQKAMKDVNYYTTECNYEVVIEIEERCQECHNQGTVLVKGRNKLFGKRVKCPMCKGKFPHNSIVVDPVNI